MCGIVGYIGQRNAVDFLLEGLCRLEYRGYDSSGIATAVPGRDIAVTKTAGRIENLSKLLAQSPPEGTTGIGHTRWATHGPATDENAHPHFGGTGEVALVHNGVIENYKALKAHLEATGYEFHSGTDTEVIAHLVADCLKKQLEDPLPSAEAPHALLAAAVRAAISQLRGTYGLAVVFRDWPDVVIVARLGSPLVVGVGNGEHFIASDASPLVGFTDKIVYLGDHQLAIITGNQMDVQHRDLGHVQHDIQALEVESGDVGLEGFDHYMLKEIFEQPNSLRNAMRGRLNDDDATAVFGGLSHLTPQQLHNASRILLTACGTSWHAALTGEYVIEELARIPVEVEYASELRYRNPPLEQGTLVFGISQSGETADTLAALRETRRKGFPTLAICNVVGSTIAQESDGGIYLHAGAEIGVASTKAFTSQCLVLSMLGLYFGRLRHLSFEAGTRIIEAIRRLPDDVAKALEQSDQIRQVAEKYADKDNFLYLGRQHNFPTALEGALKLKEISYIHAEGYPAAEMKHGPIALVDENTPSVFVMSDGFVQQKVMANLEEVKARGGPVIAVATEGDKIVRQMADDVFEVPVVEDFLQPIVMSIPLQLFAYHIAVLRGCDVDKPRNLAKSVTVE